MTHAMFMTHWTAEKGKMSMFMSHMSSNRTMECPSMPSPGPVETPGSL